MCPLFWIIICKIAYQCQSNAASISVLIILSVCKLQIQSKYYECANMSTNIQSACQ